ncbi:RHS repeat-associated core domain-containing protein [Gallaecimonas pentaromativorans]|uniref:RHS repeat-associated protein n=1 Tax=Gallaecimonas pentaromativorans TaxID=584787 RepID=A0A3N1PJE6_9GAMM|nr:RHS repeat-associated core domain-containing protein [Gallaecimonas pentaromativorans]ROQ28723.1 RHS repeat-associated protein [Gallaecimonas pentaromativorans]
MNGRVYDYNLGRFLSVDPLIQSPTSTQSINPYSYVMNNPLAGTDPTGYCAAATGSHICSNVKATTTQDGGTLKIHLTGGTRKQQQAVVQVISNGVSSAVSALSKAQVTTNEIGGQKQIAQQGGAGQNSEGSSSGTLNQKDALAATTLALPLSRAASATAAIAETAASGAAENVLTFNPVWAAIAAAVYSKSLNEGEDEALGKMRIDSDLDNRNKMPVAVIGETQKRASVMVNALKRSGMNVEVITDVWPKGLLPKNDMPSSLEFNRQWINSVMDRDMIIYDVGYDPTRIRNPSDFYKLERDETRKRSYSLRVGARLKE